MTKKSKKFQIISQTIQDLKNQLEEKPSDEKIYVLFKDLNGPGYECNGEIFSSIEQFRQLKGIDKKRDEVIIFRPATEDDTIEYRKQSANIN